MVRINEIIINEVHSVEIEINFPQCIGLISLVFFFLGDTIGTNREWNNNWIL